MFTPNYEPKTDWEHQTKVNMNIRDLQGKYPNGCQCCGNIYTKDKFSILVNSHFKTKKHQNCVWNLLLLHLKMNFEVLMT